MAFQVSGIMPLGRSTFQNRCQRVRRSRRADSSSSWLWPSRDECSENARFHACEVKIAKIDAHSTPSWLCGNRAIQKVTVTDRKPRMGTDCSTSSSGMSTLDRRRERAAAVA